MKSDLTGPLIFAAVACLFIGLVVYGRWWQLHGGGKARREKEERRKAERAASAQMRGWQYDGTIVGNIHYRIAAALPDGTAWSVHYDSDQSSSSATPKLVFTASSMASPDYQWTLHDRKTFEVTQKSGVRVVVGGLSKLIGAFSDSVKVKRDFYLNAVVLPSGSAAMRERYVLAAVDSRWSSLLTREIERLALNWPTFKQTMSSRDNCFSAEMGPQGLRVTLYCDAPDFAVIEQMAKLGQLLMAESKRLTENTEPAAGNVRGIHLVSSNPTGGPRE